MFCTLQLTQILLTFWFKRRGKRQFPIICTPGIHHFYSFFPENRLKTDLFLKHIGPYVWTGSYSSAEIKKSSLFLSWQKNCPLYFPSTGTLWLSQSVVLPWPNTLWSDFSCLFLSSSFHSLSVSSSFINLMFHSTKRIGMFLHVAPQASVPTEVKSKFQG